MQLPTQKRGFEITYSEFWHLYLDAHRSPATRGMHYAATGVGAGCAVASYLLGQFWLFPVGIAAGYAMAVISHRVFERNLPLIKVNPLYGAFCDLRMLWLAATGRLYAEYRRLGLNPDLPTSEVARVPQ